MSVGRLLAETDSRELTEWEAWEKVNGPLGPVRGDFHMAVIAATVANSRRRRGPAFKVADFMPKWSRQRQSVAEQKAIMQGAIGAATREEG